MNRNLSVIIGFACCSFLLACGDDPSTGVEFSNGPEEPLESSSSAEIALGSSILAFVSSSSIVAEIPSSSSVVSVKPSSSSVASSSSSVRPVSSSAVEPPEESSSSSEEIVRSSSSSARLDPAYVVRDSMVDMRDGHVYKTVKIGIQTWMAENLDYEVEDGVKSWKYKCEEGEECVNYGRYYTWAAAIDSASLASNPTNPQVCGSGKTCDIATFGNVTRVQGVCPEGWRMPHVLDWMLLYNAVSWIDSTGTESSGASLKSVSGWENDENGLDEYGFNAYPAGYFNATDSVVSLVRYSTFFWLSTETSERSGEVFYMDIYSRHAFDAGMLKSDGLSVRCIKG